jgi:hypothetical protein
MKPSMLEDVEDTKQSIITVPKIKKKDVSITYINNNA